MKKVVIVENIKTIREGIKILVNRFSNFNCKESFEDFNDFKEVAPELKPDILLIDFQHKGIKIIDEIRELKFNYPNLIIILLIMNEENELIFDALCNGATTYVHKNTPPQKLVKVIEDAVEGMIVVNSFIARKTLKLIKDKKKSVIYDRKEITLLLKITEGNNLLAIEQTLKISCNDIKLIFGEIYKKLFVNLFLNKKVMIKL